MRNASWLERYSESFDGSDDVSSGSKRSWQWLLTHLTEGKHDVAALQTEINHVVIKTLLAGLAANVHEYRSLRRSRSDRDHAETLVNTMHFSQPGPIAQHHNNS